MLKFTIRIITFLGSVFLKLLEIKPLLQDMARHNVKLDKFRFTYNHVEFEVIVLIEREPFELLFGVIGHNYSFILKLFRGYELESLPNEVFFKLCDILKLKPSKEGLTSFKFVRYVAERIPIHYSGRRIQPHEIAVYKQQNIPEKDKIYFCGWKFYTSEKRHARNFEKTRKWLGDEAYQFCIKHNISSCWTDNINKRKDYFSPQAYLNNNEEDHAFQN